MTKENPYVEMTDEVLTENINQLKEVMEKKNLSTLQFFGESLSEDTQAKVDEHASLSQEVKTLKEAASAGTVSPDVKRLTELNVDSAISEIKKLDDNFPIEGIVNSISDPFQKINALTGVKAAVEYSQKAVNAVKSEIGNKTGVQGFGEAPATDSAEADKLVDSLIAASGVKLD
jgi:hypothetical protein